MIGVSGSAEHESVECLPEVKPIYSSVEVGNRDHDATQACKLELIHSFILKNS
jgi:hypothetical protein